MTEPSQWAKERARSLALMARAFENDGDHSYSLDDVANTIAAALDGAEKRGAQKETDCASEYTEGVEAGRDYILGLLKSPDEAMVEALVEATCEHYSNVGDLSFDSSPEADIKATLRAIADHLAKQGGEEQLAPDKEREAYETFRRACAHTEGTGEVD